MVAALIVIQAAGCNQPSTVEVVAPVIDSAIKVTDKAISDVPDASKSLDLNHKYSYVKSVEDGSFVTGLLELYGVNDYTQAVAINGLTQSGRGTYSVKGDVLTLNKSNGIAIDGNLAVRKGKDNKIWLTLDNGITYVQDDDSYYIRNLAITPGSKKTETPPSNPASGENEDEVAREESLSYEGTVTDELNNITQDYVLKIKPDWSSASIGGGPYTTIQNQGNGVYMWMDGSIIGMSFKPLKDKCIVYGSEGDYFCTLYRK